MAFEFIPDNKLPVKVYEASYLKDHVPTYFTGCKSVLNIVNKKSISKDDHYLATYSKHHGWRQVPYDSQSKTRKLLLTSSWVDKTVPGFGNNAVKLKDQKLELATDMLGVGIKDIKAFFTPSVATMPAVYLFILGNAKELRQTLNIPMSFEDDDYIVKYGLASDLERRSLKLERAYGKLRNVTVTLKYHVYIDPVYLSSATVDMEWYFKGARWDWNHQDHAKLAAIPQHMMDLIVHNEFKRLGAAYAGKLRALQIQLANEQYLKQVFEQSMANQKKRRECIDEMKRKRELDQHVAATERLEDVTALMKVQEELSALKDELSALKNERLAM